MNNAVNNPYIQSGARIASTWGGRICDLPPYQLDALAQQRSWYLATRRTYAQRQRLSPHTQKGADGGRSAGHL